MASGAYSISLSSDQVFDRNCSVCEPKGKVKEAVKYCTACSEYFCQQCLDFHNSLPMLKGHQTKLLGKSAMLNAPLPPVMVGSRDTITTMCNEHSGRLVEMFCEDHDVVCCAICAAEKHRVCENVNYIPKVAGRLSKTTNPSKLKSDLHNIEKELTRIKLSRQKDQPRIKQERDRALTQIRNARRRISAMFNTVFDKLEKSVIDGAQERHHDYGGKIQTDLDECDNAVSRIEAAIKALDSGDKTNEAQLFVDVKRGVENLSEFSELAEQIQERLGKEQIKFIIDDGIEAYIANLQKLGTFVDETMKTGEPKTLVKSKSASVGAGEPKTVVKSKSPSVGVSKPQAVDGKEDVLVVSKGEYSTPRIEGSCCLPDGGALLSDWVNDKLKRLDSSYRVTDSCSIQCPHGVCYIPHTKEAAVCQWKGPVHIVSVGRTMTVTRSIKLRAMVYTPQRIGGTLTDHTCYGVSYNNGQLYVGERSGNMVHVYDFVSGDHKSTIHKDGQGRQIFSNYIRHITTSPDGTIWIADGGKGLIQIDKSGNHLRTITDAELCVASGVCLGRDNSVLVCGYDSRTVLQLSPDGKKLGTLVQADDLPATPRSICYDKDRARLLVTMENCDHIKVFHLK